MGYDSWLEAPYQDMMEESERFYDWAEANGFEFDSENLNDEAELAYQNWIEGQYEDAAEAQAEAYLDRMEYEAEELDDYFGDEW